MRQIVSNTGPLISVEKLTQGYDFIRRLYDKVIIPLIKAFRQDLIAATEAQDKLSELLRGGRINRKIYEALRASLSKV